MASRLGHAGALAAAILLGAGIARGYEFEVSARSIGQGLELRVFRPISGNLRVDRRRFTQWLTLSIWNIGRHRPGSYSLHRPRRRGPKLSLHSSLRLDHDYADWTTGTVIVGSRILDAIDVVPELEEGAIALDVLTLYFAAEELAGDRLDVYLGRQLSVGALDWWSFDGATVRYRTPWPVQVEAFGGLRVRDSSFLASSTTELDGTGSGQCREYVEGAVPGSGAWRPIDVGVPTNNAFRNDYDICPQREELQPTVGGAVVLEGMRWLFGRVSYRRTMSPSPGLIGPSDRFEEPDTGFYPNEDGQRPFWAVNEEKLTASLRGIVDLGGDRQLVPYGAIRYSAVHGLIDEAHLGTRLRFGSHRIEPELFYSFPTFDGDSIFNVFSIQPYWDLRATYTLWSPSGRLSGYVRPWARRFSVEDPSNADPGEDVAPSDWAGGVQAGTKLRVRRREYVRLDGFAEDGYGGRRIGALAAGRWLVTRALGLGTRLSIIDFEDELRDDYDWLNLGAQLGLTYQIFQGVGFKTLGEYNHNRIGDHQVRVFAILDLAFRPEL